MQQISQLNQKIQSKQIELFQGQHELEVQKMIQEKLYFFYKDMIKEFLYERQNQQQTDKFETEAELHEQKTQNRSLQ